MQPSTRLMIRVAGGVLAFLTMSAGAHVPYLEEIDYTPDKPYIVHDVENSKSISARIGTPGDVDVYRIDTDKPTRIFTKTDIPWCPQYENFGVTYALAGPGLPPPSIPLPVALPKGFGAVVVRDSNPGQPRETWLEPFSGRQMWLGPEYALDAAPAGHYTLIVWNERGQTGDYIVVIGEGEVFNAPEIAQVRATSPKLLNGANLMVKCNPTVAAPKRPDFGKAAAATVAGRWYSPADIERGERVFATHCAVCHGARAQGAALGSLTAPPLNGAGHSAHHGLDYLLEQVTNGGAAKGGKMPAFGAVLSEPERRAAIAWIQSLWPDDTYRNWRQMDSGSHRAAYVDNPSPTG